MTLSTSPSCPFHEYCSCDEHCDDYLLLFQELLEAEKTIEELQQELESYRNQCMGDYFPQTPRDL